MIQYCDAVGSGCLGRIYPFPNTSASCSARLAGTKAMRSPKAFTLMELLIVVAIIGVLAVITLPVVQNARQSANAAKCVSNLKQIGTAFFQYAADNENKVPYSLDWYSYAGGGSLWFGYTGSYYSRTWKDLIGSYMGNEITTHRRGTVWGCPAWSGPGGEAPPYNHYCISAQVPTADIPQYRFNQISEPSKTILVAEANETPVPMITNISPFKNSTNPQLTGRHHGGGNVLFFDGSVSLLKLTDDDAQSSAWERKPWSLFQQ